MTYTIIFHDQSTRVITAEPGTSVADIYREHDGRTLYDPGIIAILKGDVSEQVVYLSGGGPPADPVRDPVPVRAPMEYANCPTGW